MKSMQIPEEPGLTSLVPTEERIPEPDWIVIDPIDVYTGWDQEKWFVPAEVKEERKLRRSQKKREKQ